MGDWWVIVSGIAASGKPNCFIMKPEEVRERATRREKREKDGRVSYWLQPARYEMEEFRDKWDRIEHGNIGTLATLPRTGVVDAAGASIPYGCRKPGRAERSARMR